MKHKKYRIVGIQICLSQLFIYFHMWWREAPRFFNTWTWRTFRAQFKRQKNRMAVGRNPLNHWQAREALSLLRNLRSAVDFVVLSSWPDSIWFAIQLVWSFGTLNGTSIFFDPSTILEHWGQNEDLDKFGGSSAYAAMEPTSLGKFKSYDLRKTPFDLPEPLSSWPEMNDGRIMLAYRSTSLQHLWRTPKGGDASGKHGYPVDPRS